MCEGQSVYESNSDFAKDIKTFVSKKIKEKNTDEDIYEFLISKYGEEIILNPDFSKKFIFLWIAPILFFLIGIFFLFLGDQMKLDKCCHIYIYKKTDLEPKKRKVCKKCGFIDYKNPKIVAGSLVVKNKKFYYVEEQ